MVLAYTRLVWALELNYVVGIPFNAQDGRIRMLRAHLNLWRASDVYLWDINALIELMVLTGVERDIEIEIFQIIFLRRPIVELSISDIPTGVVVAHGKSIEYTL
jgi:hypothetical protein